MSLKYKNEVTGWLLAVLMFIALLNSAYFFISVVRLGLVEWLAFNACSLSIIVYLICFAIYKISKEEKFLAVALVPLYYYGTMGLFVVPWDAANMIAQVTHIIITLNVIWILIVLLRESHYESLGRGLLVGLIAFVPLSVVIQNYSQSHMAEFIQMLQKAG